MRWQDALARLEALLAEERAAIRTLDAGRVLELSLEKERLVEALRTPTASRSPAPKPPADRLRRLGDDLRRNAVLLAHARDCIRDVVAGHGAADAPLPARSGRPAAALPGRRVSVTG